MVVEPGSLVQSRIVTDPDLLEAYRHDASSIVGAPDGLARPESAAEVAEILKEAADLGIFVTPCGLRTATTGSGLAPFGWALSTEKLVGACEIDTTRRTAVVHAGTVLRHFKDEVEAQGLFYPPDPTSEWECAVGGTVACDASGARTYRYGPTSRWVRGVEVALTDGSVQWFRRRSVDKDAAGYAGLRDLVSVFCGSEGTLGVVTRVEVALLVLPEAYTAGLAFFLTVEAALAFVLAARVQDRAGTGVHPRCLELLDRGCLEIMAARGGGVGIPKNAGAAIVWEEEHRGDAEEACLQRWWELLESIPGALPDDTFVATDRARREELRTLRHAVPATLNEEGHKLRPQGGKKISTDWAVPAEALPAFMAAADRWLEEAGIERVVRFGHVGNGHPHYNLIVHDPEEVRRATVVVDRMCEAACALGGTVTAEHGIGKVKLRHMHQRFSRWEIEAMRAVKRVFDSQGILAPGNLFPER